MQHGGQALRVTADAEVDKVPLQHPAESAMLIDYRPRPHQAALPINRLQRPRQTIFGGALPHHRFAFPRLAPRMDEAEERERRRQRRLYTHPLVRRAEVDELGFIRVQFQPELPQPLPQHRVHPLSVFSVHK